jgi:hypothetical protein
MELHFPPDPTPLEVLHALLLYVFPMIVLVYAARTAYARTRRRTIRILSGAFLFVTATVLIFISLSFMYPHHHHDIRWVAGRRDLNYPVDAVIGLVIASLSVVAWRVAGRPKARTGAN